MEDLKMELVSIFSCSAANLASNGGINALDIGIDRLETERFPTPFSLILIMRFEYSPGEVGSHEAVIKFIDGDGNVKDEQKISFVLQQGKEFHQVIAGFGTLKIERPDNYRFDVIVDNDFKGYWPLSVKPRGSKPQPVV